MPDNPRYRHHHGPETHTLRKSRAGISATPATKRFSYPSTFRRAVSTDWPAPVFLQALRTGRNARRPETPHEGQAGAGHGGACVGHGRVDRHVPEGPLVGWLAAGGWIQEWSDASALRFTGVLRRLIHDLRRYQSSPEPHRQQFVPDRHFPGFFQQVLVRSDHGSGPFYSQA